jgi:hypothetical protein
LRVKKRPPLCLVDLATAETVSRYSRPSCEAGYYFVWFGRAFKRAEKKITQKWATNIHRRTSIHIDCTYIESPWDGEQSDGKKAETVVGSKHSNRQQDRRG